jgi:3-hydroxyacyl-CoA dehydrogenase
VDEGTPVDVAEHAPDPLGLPMTPFLLLQLVGPAIALHVAETLHAAFPGRFAVSPKLRALVESGQTSLYRPDFSLDPEVAAALSGGDQPSTADQVRQRALAGLAEEIRLMLEAGVVAAPEDIDLCMIMGAGWPFHLGGITPYLDRTGISEKVTGSRFRPA